MRELGAVFMELPISNRHLHPQAAALRRPGKVARHG